MTSRPGPTAAQRATAGNLPRPPIQGRPAVQQHFQANARPPTDVIDLTADEGKQPSADAPPKKANPQDDPRWVAPDTQFAAQDGFSRPPPRGRPQISFEDVADAATSGLGRAASAALRSTAIATSGSLPFPPRPGFRVHKRQSQGARTASSATGGVKKDVAQRNGVVEPPPDAVRVSRGKTVDFYPWAGNHPEDNLSAEVVKVGYYDDRKGQVDLNAGKSYVGPQVKNKTTLQALSSLFVQTLEKRQASGRVREPSSFKPPPRITVKDTQREEWLRDLANPSLPPKRRIPHGIRGKLLLEQCLSKNIPIARAIWLAKCVGANEMRAWMRKGASSTGGMGGELKWVREWTVFVEQFVDSTISTCGQEGWRDKMDYTIRLASQLYTERLLDQDHYLDWLLTSLDSTEVERLPVWFLMVQIYWQDLVTVRRRGRRLAEALLLQLGNMTKGDDPDVDHPLVQRSRQLITALILGHRDCMVIPRTWKRHRHILESMLTSSNQPAFQSALRSIMRRNERLSGWCHKPTQAHQSPQKAILSALDSITLDFDLRDVATRCLAIMPDSQDLAVTVLQWACSLYREGGHRLYIAARLLRKWKSRGADIDGAVLAVLSDDQKLKGIKHRDFFRLVAELVRSKHFSVGRYLQWLIASGSLSAGGDVTKSEACNVRLIAEIPLQGLPEHVLNLRQTLLQTNLQNGAYEAVMLMDDHNGIIKQLWSIFAPGTGAEITFDIPFADLSTSVRLEISRWLRQELLARLEPDSGDDDDEMRDDYALTASRFYAIRGVMEQLEDFAILADILNISMQSRDMMILAAIADTLNHHHRTFAAIGALRPLFNGLVEQYGKFRLEKPSERSFLLALADLCCRLQAEPNLVLQLTTDITRLEQRSAVAACSPASDNMADFHSGKMDFDEEIDRILASGTTMDENMVARVFARVVSRIGEQIGKEDGRNSRYGQWLQRLKAFDDKTFDRHMSDTISSLILSDGQSLLHILPCAVGSGSLSLENFISFSESTIGVLRRRNVSAAANASLHVLDAILPMEGLQGFGLVQEIYRYRIEQEKLCQDSQGTALQLLRQAIELCLDSKDSNQPIQLEALLRNQRLLKVLRYHASRNAQDFCVAMGISPPSGKTDAAMSLDEKRSTLFKKMFDALMDPSSSLGLSNLDAEEQASALVNAADDLSVPFCQLELQLLFKIQVLSDEEGEIGVADAIIQAVKEAVEADKSIWSDLLTGLDAEMTRKIREYAETHVLSAVTTLTKARSSAEDPSVPLCKEGHEKMLQRYLSVLNLTAWSIEDKAQGQICAAILDRLRTLHELLSQAAQSGVASDSKEDTSKLRRGSAAVSALCPWICALLHLIVVHQSVYQPGKVNASHQVRLLWTLRAFLLHPELQPYPNTTEYVLDVAASLSDDLPEDARIQLLKHEANKPVHDPRIIFILGFPSTMQDSWLGLITPTQSPASGSANTPNQSTVSNAANTAAASRSTAAQHQHQGFWQPQVQRTPAQQQRLGAAGAAGAGVVTNVSGAGPAPPVEYSKPVPFQLRRWEILPDSTSGSGPNDTALSLTLFDAKKV
ncbi:RNA polymerase II mediator complex subunit [Diplodia intermedia]|uniref:Mediator of RNA polymerase II transcription subunit 12 n=1 Tax=Diplodia intermedia TaxID=856260 RepID=A0ABR3TLU1_9PEZI